MVREVAYELKFSGERLRTAIDASSAPDGGSMTQEKLAREIGVTLGAVSAWARGISEPKGGALVSLARVLGRDESWFFTELEREAA